MSANILRRKVWMRTKATTSRQRARLQVQPLEPRDVPAATLAVDFNTNLSPTAPNFMGDKPGLYSPGVNHMGWQSMTGMAAMDRATTNPLTRDFQYGKDGTFLADSLPQGTYNVVIGLGDASAVRDLMSVWAQGQQLAANVTTKSGQALEIRGRVVVGADGMFTLHLVDGGGKSPNFALDYLTLTPDDPSATGLWPADTKPAGTGSVSSQGAELGLKFQSDVSGFVTGIRFYKGTGNTGTHTGSLWSADGTRLATATFSGESASGWQTVTFATPVAIQANTTYVASYHSPTGKDSVNLDYFTISGLTNGHLMVLPGPQGGGGVYCRGSGFPTNTNRSSNYWVDVVFASGAGPSANAGPDQSANEGSTVSFAGTAGGGTGTLTYDWDFGDGSSHGTGSLTPTHKYADNGTYTVTLTVTDANNVTASDTAVVTVANVAPTATFFNNGPVAAGTSVPVQFSNQFDPSVVDTAAGFTYSYDFNNDGTWDIVDSTVPVAATTFGSAGTYTVQGRIKDKDGGSTTYSTAVTVTGPLSANAGPDQSANEGSTVSFTGTAGGGSGALSYDWDFGDGSSHTTGTLAPTHKYADNGAYSVTLKVTDATNTSVTDTATVTVANVAPTATFSNNGPVAPGATVTLSFTGPADPSSADTAAGFKYSYDFNNDGTWDVLDSASSSATTSFAAAGTYTVKGRIKDKDGGSTTYSTTVTVTGPLSANAGPDQSANEGSAVSFTGTAGGGTGTLTYDWDFGDGSAHGMGSLSPTHKYADNGTYTVTLTVTDANNVTASDTAVVTVANVAPTATFSNNGPVTAGSTVTLSFTSPSDPSTADTAAGFKYSYDFNNDGTWDVADSANSSATTSFAAAGTYTVKGRIKDKDGGSTDYTTTVTVNNPSSGLVGDFQFNEGSGTTTASGVGSLTGTITNATWVTGGHTGGALSFNGSNSVVTVPDTATLDLTTGMTLEAWIKPSAVGNWESVALKERPNGLDYALYGSDNSGKAAGYINTGGSDVNATGTTNPPLNTWTHLAVTYDGANLRLYTNGTLTSTTAHAGSLVTSTGNLSIGGNSVWGEYFNGLIDELRIYNRALTATEIQSDMNAAPTVTAVSPANGATGIATTAAVKVTFSKAMDPATVTSANVQLKTSSGSVVSGSVTYDSASQSATLTPSAALSKAATYTVVVHSGSGGVADSTGKLMASDFTSSFTTTDGSPPTANAGPDQSANEGAAVSFSGSASGGVAPYTYDWNWGDGSSHTTGTLTPTHKYADNGTYTVTLTVTDANNVTASDTAVVTVANVAPTATLSNGGPVTVNTSVAITFTNPSDPSTADTAAGFKYSYDFNNDGTWDVTDSANSSATTSFAAAGTYTVKGRIKDKDGGSTTYSTTVTVTDPSAGHTYYVSPTGSDSNTGSSTAPYLTLQKGVSVLQPGDTLTVRAGTYNGFIVGWDPAGSLPYGVIAGTAAAPITIQADPGAAPGSVIINGRSAKSHVGIDLEPGCDYITVSGFLIDGSGGIANYPDKGSGIKAAGDHDSILNNAITSIDYGFGITSNYANFVRIENNTITHTGSHGVVNYGHGIYVAGDCTGARVVGNSIHDNDYIGLQFNGDPGLVTNALVANNRIYNNGQNGINADGLQSSTIQNNLIYGYDGYGIVLFQIDASGPSMNNTIVNNTIVSTVAGAGAAVRILDGGTGNVLRNNILLGGGGVSLRISSDSMSGLISDYNVVGTLFQSEDTGATQSLASWRSQTGQDAHSLTTTASSLFVNAAANDYHLSATSPAIDKGTSTSAPLTDIDGNARPHGAGIDIGAFEYQG